MSASESLIAKISKSITRWDSFKIEKKHIWDILYNEFAPLSEADRNKLYLTTNESAMNLLRQRFDKSRFIAFVVISFLIEINDDESRFNQLSIDLEKLLPLESITLLEGISYLFKRISELQSIPYNRRIYDRCIQFLSNRLTPSAIQTAIIILYKMKPNENLAELASILWSGIKFPNKMIQKMAVNLFFHCISHFPNSEDSVKGMMSMCNFSMQQSFNPSEGYGAFILIKAFIKKNYDIISESFSELFTVITTKLKKNHDFKFLKLFLMLCERHKQKAHEHINDITELLNMNWDLNNPISCDFFVRIASLFSEEYGELCYNRAKNVCEDSYFKLISVKFGSYSDINQIIEKFRISSLTESYINAAYSFLKAFPQYSFRFNSFLISKTDECLTSESCKNVFILIHKFVDIPILPFLKYWDLIFNSLKSPELSIESKKFHILALLSILHNDINNKYEKMLELLFVCQSETKEVFETLLDNIDDQILHLFMDETLRVIVSSLSLNDATPYLSIIKLFIRLRKVSALSTFNIFIDLISNIPNSYMQYSSYKQKKLIIATLDLIIDGAGDILEPYATTLYQFCLELISSKLPKAKNFNEWKKIK